MKYNKIDRTNIDFTSDAEVCNIGYFEKYVKDIPIRIEKFVTNGITCITIFIPKIEIFNDEKTIKKFLQDNNIIEIIDDKIYVTELEDVNNNEFLSINVPLESINHTFNKCTLDFKDYEIS